MNPSLPQLPNYDLHNHTVYCGHAEESATVANIITRANDLRLDCLGISEHLMGLSDLVPVRALQLEIEEKRENSRTRILFGVEMDLDPASAEGNWIVPDFDCDYIILSAHDFPQFDLDIPNTDRYLSPELQRRRLAGRWLQWYGRAIQRGGFDILGHPLREPINMGILSLYDPEVFQAALVVFQPAIDRGIAFELNNAYLAYLTTSNIMAGYVQLIRFLRDKGMKFSRGSDSHGIERVGATEGIVEVARAAGLTASDWYQPLMVG